MVTTPSPTNPHEPDMDQSDLYRLLTENLGDLIALIDDAGQVIYQSPAISEAFGIALNQPPDTALLNRLHPDDRVVAEQAWRQALTGQRQHFVCRFRDTAGAWRRLAVQLIRVAHRTAPHVLAIGTDVTASKQAETAQSQARRQLDVLAENLPDCLMRFDHTGRFRSINPAVQHTFNTAPESFLGRLPQEISQLGPAEQRTRQHAAILHALETNAPNSFEALWSTAQGERRFEVRYFPEHDEQGQVSGVLGIARDITAAWRAEQQRTTHLRFLESLDLVNRAIQGSNDLDEMMRDVLDSLLLIFACDRAWLTYPCDPDSPWWMLSMERTAPEYPGTLAFGTEQPMTPDGVFVFSQVRAADGPVAFGPGSVHPVPEQTAQLFDVRSMLVMALYPKVGKPWSFGLHQCSYERVWSQEDQRLFQEIGRRISDALNVLLAYRDLKDSEVRFRLLMDHTIDAFFLHSANGAIIDVNRQACISLGYSREELIGKHPTMFDTEFSKLNIDALLATIKSHEVYTFESVHRRKDGSTFAVEIRSRLFYENGEWLSIAMVRDITERKRLEERMRQAQKMEAVGRLASGVAHDFNNLLTIITGNGELLLESLSPDSPQHELLSEMLSMSDRAAGLTRQLLAFGRQQPLDPRSVDLNRLIATLTAPLQRLLGSSIRLQLIPDTTIGPVQIDPAQCEHAIINLVINARDAMPNGGELTIRTHSMAPDGSDAPRGFTNLPRRYIILSVHDTGTGMDSATRAQIFEPFFSTKTSDKGTGLGLAMVYGFVTQSGGQIEVESEVGRGTTFYVYLPCVDVDLSIAA